MRLATRRGTVLVLALLLCTISIVLIVLVHFYGKPDRYRLEVISYLEGKTGKQIEIGHIGVNWIPLSIRLDNFATINPKPFPAGYFLKVPRVDAVIDAAALLHRQIVIKSIVLHDPIINVISDPDGLWNFENPPSKTSQKRVPIFALGVISRVEITGGQLFASALIDPSDRPGPVVFEVHNLSATLRQVDFNAFIGPPSSIVAEGDMMADSLRFGSIQATNARSKLRLLGKQVFFDGVSVDAYKGHVLGDLGFALTGPNATFTANARTRGVDMAHLLTAFPGARGKMTGTMEGEFKLAGEVEHSSHPLAGIHGIGYVTIRKGELPTLNLNENLIKLARLRGRSSVVEDPAAFISISGDLDLSHQSIFSRAINILGYSADIHCSGTVGLAGAGALDYQGQANLLTKQVFFTNIVARISGAKLLNGKLSFPIRVAGTLQAPKFSIVN